MAGDDRGRPGDGGNAAPAARSGRFLGSLKDALAAASRDETGKPAAGRQPVATEVVAAVEAEAPKNMPPPLPAQSLSAAEAAREVRGGADRHQEYEAPPTTKVLRAAPKAPEPPARTQLVRGKQAVKRTQFHQDPVVGWLVVVGGLGMGAFRAIYEGNNTIGRASTQRIALDFGDDAISSEEQAYIRYDSGERSFLFGPNLAKTNVVSVNNKRPTAAVELSPMDVITIGRTQVVFVPFCGPDFDWAEIADAQNS
jgi:hypothetical protein